MRSTLFLSIALALQAATFPALAQTPAVTTEAIPAQPLDRALNALSRRTGLQFIYDAQAAGNPRTRPIAAGLSAEEALRQLLAGTGLRYRFVNATTVTIEAEPGVGEPGVVAAAPAGTTAAAAAATASPAESPLHQLDRIEVTGSYSRSLEQAVDLKRWNIGFSDSIVATDVADFPEQNLAEALQRMPGVTIERNKGLGTKVMRAACRPSTPMSRSTISLLLPAAAGAMSSSICSPRKSSSR